MNKSKHASIQPWSEYSLIDCGDGRKLERFGNIVLIRPEPAAIWSAKLSHTVGLMAKQQGEQDD